jgi:hypothetical protein
MLTPGELARISEVCVTIGNQAGDDAGFVPIRSLLARFQAQLISRPLLVEGMLASVQDTRAATFSGSQWTVLVDSETYPIPEGLLDVESSLRPLPTRLRNTIAHELVHSLAFRPAEFGVRIVGHHDEKPADLVHEIEKETERLSPLLLFSEIALRKLLAGRRESLSVSELVRARRNLGISRYLLINRLRLLQEVDSNGFLFAEGLRNLAIGLAEWVKDGRAVVRKWPLFLNFDRNMIPAFLHELARNQDRIPAGSLLGDDNFAMCGGTRDRVVLETHAGTRSVPNALSMTVEVEIERRTRNPGNEFLFAVRKRDLSKDAARIENL